MNSVSGYELYNHFTPTDGELEQRLQDEQHAYLIDLHEEKRSQAMAVVEEVYLETEIDLPF